MKIPNIYSLPPSEFMKVILDAVNRICAGGYRFNGVITSVQMNSGGAFLFEKTSIPYKYIWKYDDEVVKYDSIQRRKGGIIADREIIKIYESMGDIHAITQFPEINNRLVFFVSTTLDEGTSEETLKLYDVYLKETGKNAIFQGKETKAFNAWKETHTQ